MAAPVSAPEGRSRWVDLDGPVHYLDFGGPADGPLVVAVHGLGGSAVNWAALAPRLTDRCRVLAPDLAGHGLTRSLGRGTAVAANRVLLDRFLESVTAGPVLLMGNSMGGMIALLEAGTAPERVAGLVLVDAALPFVAARPDPMVTALIAAYATPFLGSLLMNQRRQLSPEALVAGTLALCCVDPRRVPADVVATAGYLRGRPYRRGIRAVRAPVLLVHGDRDRLVPLAAARAAARRHPSWSLVVLPDVGHVPQLEAPDETARAILDWLDSAGRPALPAATP